MVNEKSKKSRSIRRLRVWNGFFRLVCVVLSTESLTCTSWDFPQNSKIREKITDLKYKVDEDIKLKEVTYTLSRKGGRGEITKSSNSKNKKERKKIRDPSYTVCFCPSVWTVKPLTWPPGDPVLEGNRKRYSLYNSDLELCSQYRDEKTNLNRLSDRNFRSKDGPIVREEITWQHKCSRSLYF